MDDRLTREQSQLLLPNEPRHPVRYGMSLEEAVRLPGVDWAENAVRAGHVPGMEGVDLLLKARILANRSHMAGHDDDISCPTDWECLDVIPQYEAWQRLLQREIRLHLMAARSLP